MLQNGPHGFWWTYRRSFSRLAMDRRVWPVLFQGTVLIVVLSLYLLFAIGLILPPEQRFGQLVFNTIILGLGIVAFLVLRLIHRAADTELRSSILGDNGATPPRFEVNAEVREYLEERMYVVSALLARGVCEVFGKAEPTDVSNGVRQRVNQVLRDRNLWPKLEAAEAELSGLPAGEWATGVGDQVVHWIEQLRLLRWVFQLDKELSSLAQIPYAKATLLDGIFTGSCERTLPITRAPWELRVERDFAHSHLVETLREVETREQLRASPWPTGFIEWMNCAAEAATSRPQDSWPLLMLTDVELSAGATMALARLRYAEYLKEIIEGVEAISYSAWQERAETQMDS